MGWGGGTSLHTTCLTGRTGPQAIHTSGGLGVDVHCWPCRVVPGGGARMVIMVALTVLATELGVGAMCMDSISGGKTAVDPGHERNGMRAKEGGVGSQERRGEGRDVSCLGYGMLRQFRISHILKYLSNSVTQRLHPRAEAKLVAV